MKSAEQIGFQYSRVFFACKFTKRRSTIHARVVDEYINLFSECIYGGLNTDVMGHGTPKQCVDMAKRAIDELGCEGGLVLTENKFTAFPNDMNPENLKAVANFVLEYRG